MKKNIIVLKLAIIVSLSVNSQILKVPEAVLAAFKNKFPDAGGVKWGKENATEYEAEFKLNNTAVSANFKLDGSWVETETTISIADLPEAVSTAVTKKYPGAVITMAEKTEMPGNKIIYEVAIKINGRKKALELNPGGGFVK